MVDCQGQQHHQSSVIVDAMTDQQSYASHHHVSSDAADPSLNLPVSNTIGDTYGASAEPCEACDHCCSIHCVSLTGLSAAADITCHDQVLQISYFHTSSVVLPQERPPKSV